MYSLPINTTKNRCTIYEMAISLYFDTKTIHFRMAYFARIPAATSQVVHSLVFDEQNSRHYL